MVGTKNHVVFLQYMPNKRHSQFGIKKFELCDSATEYAMLVELYAGKGFAIRSDMGQAHGVVMDLVRKANVLDKGYHLFVYKASLSTDTFGNFKKGLPSPPTKMDVGTMLSYRHQQRKPVLMFSTATAAGMVEERTRVGVVKQKPKCVSSYNKYVGGMDISDRKIYHVYAERPSKRYWKVFFNLIDMAQQPRAVLVGATQSKVIGLASLGTSNEVSELARYASLAQ